MDVSVELTAAAGVTVVVVGGRGSSCPGPAVYAFEEYTDVFYVGMSGNPRSRLLAHKRAGLSRGADRVKVYPVDTVRAAQRLEANLIGVFRPDANDALTKLSAIELAWYRSIRQVDAPQGWTWCVQCGELHVVLCGVYLQATFHSDAPLCPTCESEFSPGLRWDPSGSCWELPKQAVASFFGAGRRVSVFDSFKEDLAVPDELDVAP